MTKDLDKEGLVEYTKKMKTHVDGKVSEVKTLVEKNALKLGESSGTAYDGAKGKANADFIASLQEKGDTQVIVSPVINGAWKVYNAAGVEQPSMGGAGKQSLSLEYGYQVSWSGSWKWTHVDGKKDPTSTSGSFGSSLPASGVEVAYPTPDAKVGSNISISQSISVPRGVKWSLANGYLEKVSAGSQSASTSSFSASFSHRRYYGLTTAQTITADAIKALPSTELNNSKGGNFRNISASDTQYWVLAYPAALGDLTKIVQNGATPLLNGGFVKTQVDVVNAAGKTVKYNVYKTEKPGALKDSSFLDIA